MRFHALATDYDGTLATNGRVGDDVRAGLERLRSTGRKIILVTGRRLDDLQTVCPDLSTFDVVVAENGAVLYWPATRELRPLVEPPPPLFAETLEKRGVPDVARGHVIVATWQPHETVVLEVIRELGLEMQVIFNKGAVMVLPSGVNKATGLRAALDALQLSPHNVVSVGDAENDHALLAACACGVAVANALPMLRERADLITTGDHGAGVLEVAQRLIANDLVEVTTPLARHALSVGGDAAGAVVTLPAYGANVLLAGTSGSGKSTFATAFLERLDERAYQYCVLDPEGDHGELPGATMVGSRQEKPAVDQLLKLLEKPGQSVVVNMLAVDLDQRPAFFADLIPRLEFERSRFGHPHWVVLDEVHHLAPRDGATAPIATRHLVNLFMITVHPEHVSKALLSIIDVVVVVGTAPGETLGEIAAAVGVPAPRVATPALDQGEAVMWWPRQNRPPVSFRSTPPQTERRRHVRKYAEGELPPERSFYFRGPERKLNLRAQNLTSFLQLGEGVDDETWLYHLRQGEYSRWLNTAIKDSDLAAEVEAIERGRGHAADAASETRRAIKVAIERRYTAAG
ncbi:MAG: HAD-IIB family hydrolase [Myxococcales bacterium]